MKPLLIIGSGGHGKSVLDCVIQVGKYDKVVFATNNPAQNPIKGFDILNEEDLSLREIKEGFAGVVVAIGDNASRLKKVDFLESNGVDLPVLVHPRASVSPLAHIEHGTVVMAGAVVNAYARVGRGCIINTGSIVEHECVLGAGVHLSPNVTLGGGTAIGIRTWMCVGSCAADHLHIGSENVVAAGSVVIKDIENTGLYAGVPAKLKRRFS